jgi:hypothetical protein
MFGTGKIYPIAPQYPYEPKIYTYSQGGVYNMKKIFNLTTGAYDEVAQIDLYRKSVSPPPHFEGIKQPDNVQSIIKTNINSITQ